MSEFCQAEIWPSWANHWVRCGSAIINGRCAAYGHKPKRLEQPSTNIETNEVNDAP